MIDTEILNSQPQASLQEEVFYEERSKAPGLALIGFLTELANHKRFVAIVTGIAMLLGVSYSLLLPTLYTATTKIMTPRPTQSSAALLMSQSGGSSSGSLALAAASGGFALRNPNDIYMGLLSSRPIEDAIIRRFGLMDVYHAKTLTTARGRLAENTNFASEKSSLIAISFTDKDRQRAADVANAYTQELSALTKSLALTEASHRRMFYDEQLKTATKDLAEAQFDFERVEQTRGVIQPDVQAKAIVSGIADLQARAAAKQVEMEALRSYSTEKNPALQLEAIELNTLKGEIAQAQQMTPHLGSADLGIKGVASAGLEFLRAEHELQYRQMLLDLLVRQYDAARLDESNDAAVIAVVEPAIPPEMKSLPHRATITIEFFLVGCFSACSYILLRDFLRRNNEIARGLKRLKGSIVSR